MTLLTIGYDDITNILIRIIANICLYDIFVILKNTQYFGEYIRFFPVGQKDEKDKIL